MEDFERIIIPMDDAIDNFRRHLDSHPRVILSAKYGDGKSFFLAEAEEKLQDSYTFLNLYPVNYQVAGNDDIFEYIKRDILYQAYANGMVPDSYDLPDDIALFFFLHNKWEEVVSEVFRYVTLIPSSKFSLSLGAIRFLRAVKKNYNSFQQHGGVEGEKLNAFIEKFEEKGIYEADPITKIIQDIVQKWQENSSKKVCLVFEDMDRIDPGHIFRILNIISAHIDYCGKYGIPQRAGQIAENKFGVDRVIISIDYTNLNHIFSHLYGENADFDGYINKFCDRGVFYYSIRDEILHHFVQQLALVSEMDEIAVLEIVKRVSVSNYSLRQLFHSVEAVNPQFCLPHYEGSVIVHKGLYVIVAVLKRLGIVNCTIKTLLNEAISKSPDIILPYFLGQVIASGDVDSSNGLSLEYKDEGGCMICYKITSMGSDGKVNLKRYRNPSYSGYARIDVKKEVDAILRCVYD